MTRNDDADPARKHDEPQARTGTEARAMSPTQRKILSVALPIFAGKGYDGTSMSDIAGRVGIRKASLYAHYAGKEELFLTLLDLIIEEHSRDIVRIVDGTAGLPPRERLSAVFVRYLEHCYGNERIDFWTQFYYFPPLPLRDTILTRTQEAESLFRDRLREIVSEGIRSGELRGADAESILVAYYHLLVGFLLSMEDYADRASLVEAANRSLSVLWTGAG